MSPSKAGKIALHWTVQDVQDISPHLCEVTALPKTITYDLPLQIRLMKRFLDCIKNTKPLIKKRLSGTPDKILEVIDTSLTEKFKLRIIVEILQISLFMSYSSQE